MRLYIIKESKTIKHRIQKERKNEVHKIQSLKHPNNKDNKIKGINKIC